MTAGRNCTVLRTVDYVRFQHNHNPKHDQFSDPLSVDLECVRSSRWQGWPGAIARKTTLPRGEPARY